MDYLPKFSNNKKKEKRKPFVGGWKIEIETVSYLNSNMTQNQGLYRKLEI